VATSRGFKATWSETSCTLDLWADELANATYGRRALPLVDDLDRLTGELTSLAPRLRQQHDLPHPARGVIFAPGVVDELLGRLLLPNLSGRAIRDGRSPYTRADLEAGRTILRPDLDLLVDTTIPWELATAPCSPEGVPAGRVALIAGGRLASPMLDLETAEDFGLPPTPVPRGRPSALLVSREPSVSLAEAAAMLGDGVVVRDLPGLHTQQPRRSRYALVVSDAQVVRNGVPGGRCAVRVAGSLLDHLSQPSTRLVRMSRELGVGLLVLTGVELLPA
jgi:predicted Zn-dependent protease